MPHRYVQQVIYIFFDAAENVCERDAGNLASRAELQGNIFGKAENEIRVSAARAEPTVEEKVAERHPLF